MLHEKGGEDYLHTLKQKSTEEIRKNLMEFLGVGEKVADCILLFSFDRLDVVPVDVHVFHIAKRGDKERKKNCFSLINWFLIDYNLNENLNHVSISKNPAIKQAFEKFFGNDFCGWAHTVRITKERKILVLIL